MKSSLQNKLRRVRPPRVKITYDVEIGDAIEARELPFIVGVLADLSGEPVHELPRLGERSFITIDRDNIDAVVAKINPRLHLRWPDQEIARAETSPASRAPVELYFQTMEDFYPIRIIERVEELNLVFVQRNQLRDFLAKLDGNDLLYDLVNQILLDPEKQRTLVSRYFNKPEDEWVTGEADCVTRQLIDEGGIVHDPSQEPLLREMLGAFTNGVIADDVGIADANTEHLDCVTLVNKRTKIIDKILGDGLDAILHHEDFQRLKGSWRGLEYLVRNSETSTQLKFKLLNATKAELLNDLTKAVEFDQSELFKLVYENEYESFNGEPYGVLIGDYDFGGQPDDFEFLKLMSQVAAKANAPFIANAHLKMSEFADFSKLHEPRDFSKIFDSQELSKWRSFRETRESTFITLTFPRVLIRLPYSGEHNPVEGIGYDEKIDSTNSNSFLWSGSAFALAQRVTNAFALYGWTAAITGAEGGGLINGLPSDEYNTSREDISLPFTTEVAFMEQCNNEINGLGFMAICHCTGSNKAAFFDGHTPSQPGKDNAKVVSTDMPTLRHILPTSRFMHYIKVIMRDRAGAFMTRSNVEDYLNTWIAQYVLLEDSPPQDIKARYPLRQARVEVSDVPGKPGSYLATVTLKPHFQLDDLKTSLKLLVDISI